MERRAGRWGLKPAGATPAPLVSLAIVLILLGCLGLAIAGCSRSSGQTNATPGSSAEQVPTSGPSTTTGDLPAQVADGSWELRVDRAGSSMDPKVAFDFLPESYYQPIPATVSIARIYQVAIFSGGTRITVEGNLGEEPFGVEGTRASTDKGRIWYELSAFAGGRFVIWQTADGLQGELTVYGSGVPILFSYRGALVRVD